MAILPSFSMIPPGAVPLLFLSTMQPTGIMACLTFTCTIGLFKRAKYASISCRHVSLSFSSTPIAAASVSFVMSSCVGPSPPDVIIKSERDNAVLIVCVSRSSLSPTTVW